MTSLQTVYDAFLAKISEDEWDGDYEIEEMVEDWRAILDSAIPFFKFPRVSLLHDDDNFAADLGNDEIQILANLMKEEWLSRVIHTWENVKVMYDERDFSQANLLDKFIKLLDTTQTKNKKLQKLYSRSITDASGKRKPYDYTKWAGGDKND